MSEIINEKFFKPVLDFNEAHQERIKCICEPLQQFDITEFAYVRVFDNGAYFSISNSPTYLRAVFPYDYCAKTDFFKEVRPFLSKYTSINIIWPDSHSTDNLILLLRERGVHNGFHISRYNAGTWECYFFASQTYSPSMSNFYIDRFVILQKFITYFHAVAADLLNPLDLSRQGVSPQLRNYYPHIEDIVEKETPWEKEVIAFNKLLETRVQEEIYATSKKHALSSRELQCLSHLSTGRTAKEIGRMLNIGPRTVETYVNRLRVKTSCQNRRELSNWFAETFQTFLNTPSMLP